MARGPRYERGAAIPEQLRRDGGGVRYRVSDHGRDCHCPDGFRLFKTLGYQKPLGLSTFPIANLFLFCYKVGNY